MRAAPVFPHQRIRPLAGNDDIATVTVNGANIEVTPMAAGTVEITLTAKTGDTADAKVLATATVEVTVKEA